jgi:hypothetical protein
VFSVGMLLMSDFRLVLCSFTPFMESHDFLSPSPSDES